MTTVHLPVQCTIGENTNNAFILQPSFPFPELHFFSFHSTCVPQAVSCPARRAQEAGFWNRWLGGGWPVAVNVPVVRVAAGRPSARRQVGMGRLAACGAREALDEWGRRPGCRGLALAQGWGTPRPKPLL